jgi:hypothetical protein
MIDETLAPFPAIPEFMSSSFNLPGVLMPLGLRDLKLKFQI